MRENEWLICTKTSKEKFFGADFQEIRRHNPIPCENLAAAKVQHDQIIMFHLIQTNNLSEKL